MTDDDTINAVLGVMMMSFLIAYYVFTYTKFVKPTENAWWSCRYVRGRPAIRAGLWREDAWYLYRVQARWVAFLSEPCLRLGIQPLP